MDNIKKVKDIKDNEDKYIKKLKVKTKSNDCGDGYKVPSNVKRQAKIGLIMHKLGYKGGTSTGWDRARQLIYCDEVDEDTIQTMKAWFARHEYTSYPGYKNWVKKGKPLSKDGRDKSKYRGAVSWLIWGGDEGKSWVGGIDV